MKKQKQERTGITKMGEEAGSTSSIRKRRGIVAIILIAVGIFINLAGANITAAFSLPLYLDCIGTVVASVLGGFLPGIAVGFLTNIIKSFSDPSALYYGVLNVLIAVVSAYFADKKRLKKLKNIVIFTILLSLIGGGIGSVLTWFLYGFAGEGISVSFVESLYDTGVLSMFQAQLLADYLIDLADKIITVIIAILALNLLPEKLEEELRFNGWRQRALNEKERRAVGKNSTRSVSLRTKILLIIIAALFSIAFVASVISYQIYFDYSVDTHTRLGEGVASLAASVIDPEKVDEYIESGDDAEGYAEVKKLLYGIRDSSPDIEYVYVYKIDEEGCHVVFDLDTEELTGEEPGTLIPFDESFDEYIPALLAGEKIEPIITDDTYGWLLTAYQPVYDANGKCVCYAAADVSMNRIRENGYSFLARMSSLFLGFFILVLALGVWLAEYNLILPVNTMAYAAKRFASDSDEEMEKGVERIEGLDIHTGDEIEHLYKAFSKMTRDNYEYVEDIRDKTEAISRMQNGLIWVLADMVERRDEYTGNHVRNTAKYAKIIMEQMKKEGSYADQLTDEFIENVVNAAPLHDVGKIHVSDTILNKPGKLTDEEFDLMKKHTTAGCDIIQQAMDIVPDSDYLKEAKNLATYHHEKWNGKGYPEGLSGEDIPLSARIMAVADVFDALVSRRSYKPGMPFEKAISIIREDSGTHFDPVVAQAFLNAEDKVRKVAEDTSNTPV